MTKHDADKHIIAGIPGVYRFELAHYDEVPDFLREFRRYESLCRTKGYVFEPSLNASDHPPFDAFNLTIQPTGTHLPFVAFSRKDVSRKLSRL